MVRAFRILMAAAVLSGPAHAQSPWVGSWATSQQIPEDRNALPPHDLDDATLRQTVHLSIVGPRLRVRLSNAFGTAPLHIAGAHIARAAAPGSDAIAPDSDTQLRFAGQGDVTIPAGAEYVSDPVSLAGADIAISLYFDPRPRSKPAIPARAPPPICCTAIMSPAPHCPARRNSITGFKSRASTCPRAKAR